MAYRHNGRMSQDPIDAFIARTRFSDAGIVPAIEWQLAQFRKRSGLVTRFRTNTDQIELTDESAMTVYRTLQEALTNVIKHAGARGVRVDLIVGTRDVSLEIADDGRGLQPADRTRPTAFGLRGMAERASRLGGWIDIDGRAGSRSVAMTRIPASASRRVKMSPIGPCPATSTESPRSSARRRMAFRTVLTGSSRAPSINELRAGMRTTPGRTNGITRTYSA